MKRWVKKMFAEHNAWQRARSKLPWPEKVRIARSIYEDLIPFRKMREEWQKKNAATREDPPKQEPR